MRIPSATYRVQFNLNFRYNDATALVPYLHDLGISHLYASPRFKARKGSSHGYDVADPAHINSELGTEEEFDALVKRLKQYGMSLLLDIVPNHMAASGENPWWMDLLENGQASAYASFFDINWHSQRPKLSRLQDNRVLLPVLPDNYNHILLGQGIQIWLDEKGFYFQHENHRYPIDPKSYPEILECCAGLLKTEDEQIQKQFRILLESSRALSIPNPNRSAAVARKQTRTDIKNRLWQLYYSEPAVRRALDETLRAFNGVKGEQSSFSRLNSLHSHQAYRLAHWRLASDELNYRRFFDINDLIGLRTEEPIVFAARHAEIIKLIQEKKVAALRIDHIDGLLDPLTYLQRIQAANGLVGEENSNRLNIYTVVEKITSGAESLPPEWLVNGTTGYDFINAVNALFVDQKGLEQLERFYREFSGTESSFSEACYEKKKQVMQALFRADIDLLLYRLGRIAALYPEGQDVPVRELERGLIEVTVCLPVYRTYYRDAKLSERDRPFLEQALSGARAHVSTEELSQATYEFLRKTFLAELNLGAENELNAWCGFILRWQQFTGAVMAKGLEDTTLFVHHGLASLNEVGNNPVHEDIQFCVQAFHQFNIKAQQEHPHTLNATSTHDTKWSEDFRARINVLSEIPSEWRARLSRWTRLNKSKKTIVDGRPVPTNNEEVLLYQAMLGIWPLEAIDFKELRTRVETFFIKAAREAKTHTNWLSPNEKHEAALRNFIRSLFEEPARSRFLRDFRALHREISFYGAWNSCSQTLLKMACPGVPDFFQGNELWNFRLTDPDNRQPIDFQARQRVLSELKGQNGKADPAFFADLLQGWSDGRLKFFLTVQTLNFRRSHLEIFTSGDYVPLRVEDDSRHSICAFSRQSGAQWIIVAVPRLLKQTVARDEMPIATVWKNRAIVLPAFAPRFWNNIFTSSSVTATETGKAGATLAVREIFDQFPFALLSSYSQTASAK